MVERTKGLASQVSIKIFSSTNPTFPSEARELLPSVITDEYNQLLCLIPIVKEIRIAIFILGSNKCPVPDGKSALFYKKFWEIVKVDSCEVVFLFF